MEPEQAAALGEALARGDYVICRTRCWDCQFGEHPATSHSWADQEDIDHARNTGQADPTDQLCGCWCLHPEVAPDGPISGDGASPPGTVRSTTS